jgi:xanthine dehydrogenase molybdopterin-binding subunit B
VGVVQFNPPEGGLVVGDVDTALKTSAQVASGSVTVGGQKHFYMELQNCVAEIVDDDTLEIVASSQVCCVCVCVCSVGNGVVSGCEGVHRSVRRVLRVCCG